MIVATNFTIDIFYQTNFELPRPLFYGKWILISR